VLKARIIAVGSAEIVSANPKVVAAGDIGKCLVEHRPITDAEGQKFVSAYGSKRRRPQRPTNVTVSRAVSAVGSPRPITIDN